MAGSLDKYTKPEKSTRVLINLPPFFYFDANYFCYLHGQFSVLGNGTLAPGTPRVHSALAGDLYLGIGSIAKHG